MNHLFAKFLLDVVSAKPQDNCGESWHRPGKSGGQSEFEEELGAHAFQPPFGKGVPQCVTIDRLVRRRALGLEELAPLKVSGYSVTPLFPEVAGFRFSPTQDESGDTRPRAARG